MKLYPLSREGEANFADALKRREADEREQFQLMTTLRYDPRLKHLTRRIPIAMEDSDDDVFFLSKLHHQRLKYGAKLLGWDAHMKVSHTEMVAKMHEAVGTSETPKRVRVTVDKSGKMEVASNDIPERDNLFSGLSVTPSDNGIDPFYEVVLDTARPVEADVTNMIKTTDRQLYDSARQRSGADVATPGKHPREVVLVSTKGALLEGSTTSIAALRDGEWVTPKLVNGGMVGVTRSFLLELGFVKEGELLVTDLKDGDDILVFNGVQGVCAGKLMLK